MANRNRISYALFTDEMKRPGESLFKYDNSSSECVTTIVVHAIILRRVLLLLFNSIRIDILYFCSLSCHTINVKVIGYVIIVRSNSNSSSSTTCGRGMEDRI